VDGVSDTEKNGQGIQARKRTSPPRDEGNEAKSSALGAKSREPREKLEDVKLKRVWPHLAELNRAAVAQAPEQTAWKKISKKESTWIDLTHQDWVC
jgi:hypothetical protein